MWSTNVFLLYLQDILKKVIESQNNMATAIDKMNEVSQMMSNVYYECEFNRRHDSLRVQNSEYNTLFYDQTKMFFPSRYVVYYPLTEQLSLNQNNNANPQAFIINTISKTVEDIVYMIEMYLSAGVTVLERCRTELLFIETYIRNNDDTRDIFVSNLIEMVREFRKMIQTRILI